MRKNLNFFTCFHKSMWECKALVIFSRTVFINIVDVFCNLYAFF